MEKNICNLLWRKQIRNDQPEEAIKKTVNSIKKGENGSFLFLIEQEEISCFIIKLSF